MEFMSKKKGNIKFSFMLKKRYLYSNIIIILKLTPRALQFIIESEFSKIWIFFITILYNYYYIIENYCNYFISIFFFLKNCHIIVTWYIFWIDKFTSTIHFIFAILNFYNYIKEFLNWNMKYNIYNFN